MAVTRLFLAGFTQAQMAGVTGHSTGDGANIIGRHDLSRKPITVAIEAMAKLGTEAKSQNASQNAEWDLGFKRGRIAAV